MRVSKSRALRIKNRRVHLRLSSRGRCNYGGFRKKGNYTQINGNAKRRGMSMCWDTAPSHTSESGYDSKSDTEWRGSQLSSTDPASPNADSPNDDVWIHAPRRYGRILAPEVPPAPEIRRLKREKQGRWAERESSSKKQEAKRGLKSSPHSSEDNNRPRKKTNFLHK